MSNGDDLQCSRSRHVTRVARIMASTPVPVTARGRSSATTRSGFSAEREVPADLLKNRRVDDARVGFFRLLLGIQHKLDGLASRTECRRIERVQLYEQVAQQSGEQKLRRNAEHWAGRVKQAEGRTRGGGRAMIECDAPGDPRQRIAR